MEEEIIQSNTRRNSKKTKPSVITWNGVSMVRNHSIRAVAHEIMNMSSNQDLISINVEGKQSTGKTELCKTIAHLVHQMDEEDWAVSHIGKKEFINLEETVKNLKPMNNMLIFDDIAFLKANASTKQIDQMQYVLSVIRHLPGGKDVRIIIFKSFQYSKALPPFLRQNDVTLISSVDDAEVKGLADRFGSKKNVDLLRKMRVQLKKGGKDDSWFVYPMGKKMVHKYHGKNPFLPFLYYNGDNLRLVVSPLRTWIDPVCPVCDGFGEKQNQDHEEAYKQFKKDFQDKFGVELNGEKRGSNIVKLIMKIVLLKKGINCFSPRAVQGMRFVEEWLTYSRMPLERIMEDWALTECKTRMHKIPEARELKKKEKEESK